MADADKKDDWLYVAVEDPGGNEKFVGLHDETAGVSYIPAFESKEEALTCLVNMPRRNGMKYEVQAVLLESLREDARNNGFLIFLSDGQGKVIKQIEP
jgi:hypothetical protein